MSGEPSEHERFRQHLRRLEQAEESDELGLVADVLQDPDEVMATSAVLRHIDRRADGLIGGSDGVADDGSGDDRFAAWSARLAAVVDGHSQLLRRLRDWALLKEIHAGQPVAAAQLAEATDWLQRVVAETANSAEVLAALAAMGRTRRVRGVAGLRARRLAAPPPTSILAPSAAPTSAPSVTAPPPSQPGNAPAT